MNNYNTMKIKAFKAKMIFIDLKSVFPISHSFVQKRKEMAYYEYREKYFCSTDGVYTDI
jgi:hypothetical protein